MEKYWQKLKQQNVYPSSDPDLTHTHSARSLPLPLCRHSLLCLSPALTFSPQHQWSHTPLASPSLPRWDVPHLPAVQRPKTSEPLCSTVAVTQGNLPPCLPPSHKPSMAAGPPALPPPPEDTTVFVKQPWFQHSIYKQIIFLANLMTRQTFHKCTNMWFVRGNEPVDKSNTIPRSVY